MTQSTPNPPTRTLLHTRQVSCTGYACSDGTLQIDAVMQDITAGGTDLYFKRLDAGEVIHGMRLSVTLDAELVIQAAEAVMDSTPTTWCADAQPAYEVLKGLKIGPGFTRQVKALVGGTKGCTHLTELLGPLATTAMQSWYALRRETGGLRALHEAGGPIPRPHVVGSCQAYRSDGQAVEIIWPMHRRPP